MRSRTSKHLYLSVFLVSCLLLAGCGSPTPVPAPTTRPTVVQTSAIEPAAQTAMPEVAPTEGDEPTSTPIPEGILSPDDLAAFDFVIERKLEAVPLAGMALGIRWGSNPVYVQGYGFADIEGAVPTEATTVYRIASVTKQFTAAAIMQLVEEGKINLEEPVGTYFGVPESWKEITVRHLLNHTSGIPDPEDLPPRTVPAELANPKTADELVAALQEAPLWFTPGSRFRYSNAGYSLLSGIIEKVSGLSCEDYFTEHLLTPAGLDSTFNCMLTWEGIAQGYRIAGRGLEPVLSYELSPILGPTGLCSTASDLIIWQQALAAGRVVRPETFQQMTTPTRLSNGESVPYGFGLALDAGAIIHGGGTAGFRSLLTYFPDDDLTIVLLANTDVPASYSLETLASLMATRILSGSGD